MKENLKKYIWVSMAAILLGALLIPPGLTFAAENVTIDEDEYNLYIDEYPYDISDTIYAKFKTKKSNPDDYYLTFPDNEDGSLEIFEAALKKSKIKTSSSELAAMDMLLYRVGEEEDKRVSDTVNVYLPLPDYAQENPKSAVLYFVSGGKAKEISTSLTTIDDIYYMNIETKSYGTYGFLYELPDEEEAEPTPKPTKSPEASTAPKPTKKPEAGTTPKPTKKPDQADPTKTPKPSNIPITKAPSKPGNLANSSENSNKTNTAVKDSVPKTGDDFPYSTLLTLGLISLSVLGASIYKIKK